MGRFKKFHRVLTTLASIVVLTSALPADANMVGADASSWQGIIDMSRYVAAGADFLIEKATEGTGYVNSYCDGNLQEAIDYGLRVGSYHFARPELSSAEAQADFYISNTRGYIDQNVLPILDWEPSTYPSGRGYDGSVNWVLTWLRRVESAYGVKPMVYMNASTANSYDWSPVANEGYGLWLAGYPTGGGQLSNPPSYMPYGDGAWDFVAMWQWSSTAGIGAFTGDANVFYGDESAWDKYAGGAPQQPDGSVTAPVKNDTSSPSASSGCGTSEVCVIVSPGDTLSSISIRNGGSVGDWYGYRSGNRNLIYPGERVCRGGSNTATVRSYIVVSGDTLSGIAAKFSVPVGSLHGYGSGNPNLIYPGEVIRW